ncbi:hypothetical protein Y032_0011g1573 [Ancylostoma ceylanicum]|uniref:Uncharacterized protein n=1 Tax=Ancylostoma ceylanicum TaxID=53326 RepID=A0A016VGI9_9BILA|nr:hypothetical protein Y032_0011g1573 [Ancylostoma ceylanicum]
MWAADYRTTNRTALAPLCHSGAPRARAPHFHFSFPAAGRPSKHLMLHNLPRATRDVDDGNARFAEAAYLSW